MNDMRPVEGQPALVRPKIGLALGGGAARGWAHIGALEVLIEAGFAPDVIAGTSIGAVVGGCLAAGKLPELSEFATSMTKRRIVGLMDFHIGGAGLIDAVVRDATVPTIETGVGNCHVYVHAEADLDVAELGIGPHTR